MTYISVRNNKIVGVSDKFFEQNGSETINIDKNYNDTIKLIGKKIKKNKDNIKIAMICNYGDACGIATYSSFLIDALRSIENVDLKIFSEFNDKVKSSDNNIQCWNRGESMVKAIEYIYDYDPNFVLIQHEFGIFPKATHFLKMLELLNDIPYAVVLHSTYEHLDKTICTSAIKNIIVHTKEAKKVLEELGNNSNVYVIPHGCASFDDVSELWNIFQTPYSIVQFGFGFSYKGVDMAIEAIDFLKRTDNKFKDIYYCYLCSENERCKNIHEDYYIGLNDRINKLGLSDNVTIIRGFHKENIINNFLRTAKLAIFPYINNPDNIVYGASGAIRVAIANNIPVIASDSHLFDDFEGIVPRVSSYLELAREIDEIFSNYNYRKGILEKSKKFTNNSNWSNVSSMYLSILKDIERSLDIVSV